MVNMYSNTQLIKQLAQAMGFDYCGIAQAKELTEDAFR
jgi:epoxyqueuosine reductase